MKISNFRLKCQETRKQIKYFGRKLDDDLFSHEIIEALKVLYEI